MGEEGRESSSEREDGEFSSVMVASTNEDWESEDIVGCLMKAGATGAEGPET